MTARITMAALINKLRGMTDTTANDYTVGTITYWTDDQLEDELDLHQMYVNFLSMVEIPSTGASLAITYTRYETGLTDWENTPTIQDENGTTIADTEYTFDQNTGVIIFDSDTTGLSRYITGYVYNVERAAAGIWRKKAAHSASGFDFTTDNHSVKRSQVSIQYLDMARFYEKQAGSNTVSIYRGDDVV